MRASQVRLEPDVVAALRADPDVDGLSLSAASNRALRAHYGPRPTIVPPAFIHDPAPTHPVGRMDVVDDVVAPLPAPAVVRGPSRAPGACRKCGKRRAVGGRCGWCGAAL